MQVLDPLVAHLVEVHGRAERQAREDRHLRRRVAAADVVARVGLGEAPGAAPRRAPRRRSSRGPSRVRMKLVVPLTIPWMRSIGVAASDSSSTRTTGTAPATAASKRSRTPCSRAVSNSSSPCWESSCLLAVTTSLPARIAASRYSRAGSIAADQLDEQVGVREDLREVPAGARQHAADHGPAAVEALDLLGPLREQLGERRRPRCRGRAGRLGTAALLGRPGGLRCSADIARGQILEGSRAARPRARRRRGRRSPAARGTPL